MVVFAEHFEEEGELSRAENHLFGDSPHSDLLRSFGRFLSHFARRTLVIHCVQDLNELQVTFFRGDSSTAAAPQELDVELGAKGVREQLVAPATLQSDLRISAEKWQTVG